MHVLPSLWKIPANSKLTWSAWWVRTNWGHIARPCLKNQTKPDKFYPKGYIFVPRFNSLKGNSHLFALYTSRCLLHLQKLQKLRLKPTTPLQDWRDWPKCSTTKLRSTAKEGRGCLWRTNVQHLALKVRQHPEGKGLSLKGISNSNKSPVLFVREVAAVWGWPLTRTHSAKRRVIGKGILTMLQK